MPGEICSGGLILFGGEPAHALADITLLAPTVL